MDSKFAECLSQVKSSSQEQVIEAFYQLFHCIESMSLAEVCAAKRTLDLFRENITMDEAGLKCLEQILTSLKARARVLKRTLPLRMGGSYYDLLEVSMSIREAFGSVD